MVREGVGFTLTRLAILLSFCVALFGAALFGTAGASVPAWADDPTPPPATDVPATDVPATDVPATEEPDDQAGAGGAARNGTWIALGGAGVLAVLAGVIVLLARPGPDPELEDEATDEADEVLVDTASPDPKPADLRSATTSEPDPVPTPDRDSPFARPPVEPLAAARLFRDDPVPDLLDAVVTEPEPASTPEPTPTPTPEAAPTPEPTPTPAPRRFLPGAPFVAKEYEGPIRPARALIVDDVDDHEFDHPDEPEDGEDDQDWYRDHGGRRAADVGHDPYRHLFRSGEGPDSGDGSGAGEPMAADAPRPKRALD